MSSVHYPYNALKSYADCILKRPDLSSNFLSNLYPIRPLMICHATKSFPSRDGMYFSGIDVDQLLFFLSRGSHGACSSRILSGISLGKDVGLITEHIVTITTKRRWGLIMCVTAVHYIRVLYMELARKSFNEWMPYETD